MAKAGHQSWGKGVSGRGQKEGNEEGREESRKRDGRGRTRECAARPQSTSPRREPSNDAVHGGSLGGIRGSSPRGERAQQGTGHGWVMAAVSERTREMWGQHSNHWDPRR